MMLKDSVEEIIIALEDSIKEDVKALEDMRTLKKLYTREEVLSEAIRKVLGDISFYEYSTLDSMLNEIITAIKKLEEEYI